MAVQAEVPRRERTWSDYRREPPSHRGSALRLAKKILTHHFAHLHIPAQDDCRATSPYCRFVARICSFRRMRKGEGGGLFGVIVPGGTRGSQFHREYERSGARGSAIIKLIAALSPRAC